MIAHFGDFGEIVDHRRLNFLYTRHQFGIKFHFLIKYIAYECDRNIRFAATAISNKNFNVLGGLKQVYWILHCEATRTKHVMCFS